MNRYLYIFILSMLASAEAEAQQKAALGDDAPRLVVNITIDQLRSDYLETFMPLYSQEGLRKLLNEGRVYTQASYPFTPIDNASATACLSTGTTPYYNNIPAAEWLSRATLRPIHAGQAENAKVAGAENLLTSTIGDEMKIASNGAAKVFAIATDRDAAIMAAGHAGDAAIWIEPQRKQWTTSTYYQQRGLPWLDGFNRLNSPSLHVGTSQINADVTSLALQCISSGVLGVDNVTDLLSVEYNLLPSTSNQDLERSYVELDKEVAKLITTIEQRIGKDNILFVISSTGYYDDRQGYDKQYKIPTGTVYINRTAGLLNMYLSAIYGQGQYVAAYNDNQIYLDHKLIEQKHIQLSDILSRSREMLLLSDGIREAYTSLGLLSAVDQDSRLVRNGQSLTASGDIIIEIAPGWKLLNEDTHQQKQWRASCIIFPIIFYGRNITHEVVTREVTIDQIAPTICKSIHIRAPNACKSTPLN